MRAAAWALALLAGAGCTVDLGLDSLQFGCARQSDCARGLTCDAVRGVCVATPTDAGVASFEDATPTDTGAPDAAPDATTPDAGHAPTCGDAGQADAVSMIDVPDGGVSATQLAPRAWGWATNVDGLDSQAILETKGADPIDIELERGGSAATYSLVYGDPDPGRRLALYTDVPNDEFHPILSDRGLRIVDGEPYRNNGWIWTAITIRNRRPHNRTWWHYVSHTQSEVLARLVEKGSRPLELDAHIRTSASRYYIVMVTDRVDTRIHYEVSPRDAEALWEDGARWPLDVEEEGNGVSFSFVSAPCPCPRWWWLYDQTEAELRDKATRLGARIERLGYYERSGQPRFTAVLVDNAGATGSRLGDVLRAASEDASGLFVMDDVGVIHAMVQPDTPFPLGLLVAPILATTAESLSPDTAVPILDPDDTGCPTARSIRTERLGDAVSTMVTAGDRGRANAIATTVGRAPVQRTLADFGLADAIIGDNPACASSRSTITASAAASLMGQIATSTRAAPLFVDAGLLAELRTVASEEAASLTITAGHLQHFLDTLIVHATTAGYDRDPSPPCAADAYVRAIAGALTMASCSPPGRTSVEFSLFIDGTKDRGRADAAYRLSRRELLRERISRALSEWAQCDS